MNDQFEMGAFDSQSAGGDELQGGERKHPYDFIMSSNESGERGRGLNFDDMLKRPGDILSYEEREALRSDEGGCESMSVEGEMDSGDVEIPRFDLGKDIMAAQRMASAKGRVSPGSRKEDSAESGENVGGCADEICENAEVFRVGRDDIVGAFEREGLVRGIVARDIARLLGN